MIASCIARSVSFRSLAVPVEFQLTYSCRAKGCSEANQSSSSSSTGRRVSKGRREGRPTFALHQSADHVPYGIMLESIVYLDTMNFKLKYGR